MNRLYYSYLSFNQIQNKQKGEVQRITSDANLEYFLSLDVQLDVPGSQMALDFFSRRPVRDIDFDKNLLHGLVPGAPRCFAGHDTAPLFEVHRHAAASHRLTGRLASAN